MKKIKMNVAKLELNKEKIASLSTEELNQINGGGSLLCPTYAGSACQNCCDNLTKGDTATVY